MIAALAHGIIGAIIAVLIGLLTAVTPHPPATGPSAYAGPTPIVVTSPAHPVDRRPVTVTIAAMPLGVRDLRVAGVSTRPARIAPHVWRFRTTAPAVPGPWLLTLSFRLRGRDYTTPGTVLEVAAHP